MLFDTNYSIFQKGICLSVSLLLSPPLWFSPPISRSAPPLLTFSLLPCLLHPSLLFQYEPFLVNTPELVSSFSSFINLRIVASLSHRDTPSVPPASALIVEQSICCLLTLLVTSSPEQADISRKTSQKMSRSFQWRKILCRTSLSSSPSPFKFPSL